MPVAERTELSSALLIESGESTGTINWDAMQLDRTVAMGIPSESKPALFQPILSWLEIFSMLTVWPFPANLAGETSRGSSTSYLAGALPVRIVGILELATPTSGHSEFQFPQQAGHKIDTFLQEIAHLGTFGATQLETAFLMPGTKGNREATVLEDADQFGPDIDLILTSEWLSRAFEMIFESSNRVDSDLSIDPDDFPVY